MITKNRPPELLQTKGLKRFLKLELEDKLWAVAQVTGLIGTIVSLVLRNLFIAIFAFLTARTVSTELNAADVPTAPHQSKTSFHSDYFGDVILLLVAIGFIWSLAVTFHSSNEKRVESAKDMAKVLLGFIIGSATKLISA